MQRNHRLDIITNALLSILLMLLALTVLAQANPGTRLPGRDYGFYIYIGDQIIHGRLPYRDAWESKPPAIFYLNAVALKLARGSRWGIWLVELISLLGAGLSSYITTRKLWGAFPALGSLVVWLTGFSLTLQGGNLTEEYPLFLHFLSLALFMKLVDDPKRPLYNILLGLAFGISFLFRPNNAVIEAAVLLSLFSILILQRDWRTLLTQALWVGCSALLPILLTGLYFWSKGLMQDLLEASFLYNFTYTQTDITSTSPLIAGFRIFGWLAWMASAGYLIAVSYALRSRRPVYFLLLIGTPLTIYMSDLAQRNYAHYFMNWLPFLGLLCGLTLHWLTSRVPALSRPSLRWERIALSISIFVGTAFLFMSGGVAEYEKAFERFASRETLGIEIRTRTANYVNNHTEPGDLVLFWAASPGENFMSNRASPSASLFYPLYVHSAISKRLNDRFLLDIQTKRPILIVDIGDHEALSLNAEERAQQIADGFAWEYPPENLNMFFQFVEENYYLEAKVGEKTVYRLRQP